MFPRFRGSARPPPGGPASYFTDRLPKSVSALYSLCTKNFRGDLPGLTTIFLKSTTKTLRAKLYNESKILGMLRRAGLRRAKRCDPRLRTSLVSRSHPVADVHKSSELLLRRCPRGVLSAEPVLSALKSPFPNHHRHHLCPSIMRGTIGELILFAAVSS